MSVEDQVLILYALNNRHMKDINVGRILKFEKDFIKYVDKHAAHIKEEIRESGRISKKLEEDIDAVIDEVKEKYNYG